MSRCYTIPVKASTLVKVELNMDVIISMDLEKPFIFIII